MCWDCVTDFLETCGGGLADILEACYCALVLCLLQRTLVAGTHADNLGYECGGWTISWQGLSGNNLTTGTTILDGIKQTLDPSTTVVFSGSPSSTFVHSNNFDVAIYVLGEVPYAETNRDNLNLTFPMWMINSMHDQVCVVIKCVVIIVSGRLVVMQPWMTSIDALVAVWLPGMEGKDLAEVLFGDFGFSGKLPRTWPKTTDLLPMNVGDTNYDPLFPYGFGLTTEPVVEGED